MNPFSDVEFPENTYELILDTILYAGLIDPSREPGAPPQEALDDMAEIDHGVRYSELSEWIQGEIDSELREASLASRGWGQRAYLARDQWLSKVVERTENPRGTATVVLNFLTRDNPERMRRYDEYLARNVPVFETALRDRVEDGEITAEFLDGYTLHLYTNDLLDEG